MVAEAILMHLAILYLGLSCIIAAIVGGGLKAFQVEIPVLASSRRQILLAAFGFLLIIADYSFQQRSKPQELGPMQELLDTKNNDGVLAGPPPQKTEFKIQTSFYVTDIWNYHWNGGLGTTPGNIRLQSSDGTEYGPWEITAANTEEKISWVCHPNTKIPPGTYTLIDSEPDSWSWNEKTKGMGMTKVQGRPINR